jgi:hypothetical protein
MLTSILRLVSAVSHFKVVGTLAKTLGKGVVHYAAKALHFVAHSNWGFFGLQILASKIGL